MRISCWSRQKQLAGGCIFQIGFAPRGQPLRHLLLHRRPPTGNVSHKLTVISESPSTSSLFVVMNILVKVDGFYLYFIGLHTYLDGNPLVRPRTTSGACWSNPARALHLPCHWFYDTSDCHLQHAFIDKSAIYTPTYAPSKDAPSVPKNIYLVGTEGIS